MNPPSPSDGLFKSIVAGSFDAIIVLDRQGKILFWNEAAHQVFGYRQADVADKSVLNKLVPPEPHEESPHPLQQLLEQRVAAPGWHHLEFETCRADGTTTWIDLRACLMSDGSQERIVLVSRDVDETKRRNQELKLAATTDFLSGISNRREFQRVLESNIGENICLAILDVDHFKSINDQFGHAVGDQAIRTVAESLVQFFPTALCVARLGGEEFGVLMEADEADTMIQQFDRYRRQFGNTFDYNIASKFTVSIGLAFNLNSTTNVRDLLTGADHALYESKKNGRNRVTLATSLKPN
ncbi:MAG: sensor domain-containing diguanylate cyclase [Mariniblastus sp.]|nr:sensor domain-containing diguanylate cyclase [Mariniblastus sp.]